MLSFISFVLVCIGCLNWFSIGILQFDFVAGIFGSQSNIFSRLIYTLVGVAAIIVLINFVSNKGKFVVSFKKANKEFEKYQEEKEQREERRALARAESSEDFSITNSMRNSNMGSGISHKLKSQNTNTECGNDCHCNKNKDDK
jgi:uncharacterized membrane protein YuzA (DUF378 family)